MWLEVDLIRDFMAILVTCKIDEDWVKAEVAIVWITLSPFQVYGKNFHRSRASNSKENSPIAPEIKPIRDFIAVLVICKFEEHPIENEVAIDRTRSTMGFFGSQGQVSPKWIVWSRRNSNLSGNLWLPRLPASLMKIRSKLKTLSIGEGQIWTFLPLKSK